MIPLATTPASYYNCSIIQSLPSKGTELLVVGCIFMFLCVCFAVSFLDVAAKQLFPSFLDPVVAARLAEIQRMFPNLGAAAKKKNKKNNNNKSEEGSQCGDDESISAEGVDVKPHTIPHPVTGAPIFYDGVVAPEPYISTKSVDEDLVVIMANNSAFSTVSDYCSCTVRGYAMLSVMLIACGMCLSFLYIHHITVEERAGNWLGQLSLLGYMMCFLTGIVMCGPSSDAVARNANQLLWFSVGFDHDWVMSLHGIGIVCFVLLPLGAQILNAWSWGKDTMPNYDFVMTMSGIIFASAAMFGISPKLHECNICTELTGKKLSITFEIVAVFSAMVSFISYEYYAPAVCAGHEATWQKIVYATLFAPLLLMARHQMNSIDKYISPPSLLLTYQGAPVATAGPCSVIRYNNVLAHELPHIPDSHMQAVAAAQETTK